MRKSTIADTIKQFTLKHTKERVLLTPHPEETTEGTLTRVKELVNLNAMLNGYKFRTLEELREKRKERNHTLYNAGKAREVRNNSYISIIVEYDKFVGRENSPFGEARVATFNNKGGFWRWYWDETQERPSLDTVIVNEIAVHTTGPRGGVNHQPSRVRQTKILIDQEEDRIFHGGRAKRQEEEEAKRIEAENLLMLKRMEQKRKNK